MSGSVRIDPTASVRLGDAETCECGRIVFASMTAGRERTVLVELPCLDDDWTYTEHMCGGTR